ncbi:hypothetical protein DAEQUDRAFT_457629 [Daedalea quercina L-15889]|uniref:Uncharacterized protein n=1 Tax=Daedalea quercina L-15889 TaxID=1314783 RepID=A0A165N149_9APHY|nr:hypothetical protein DAEQUDRAFT_457629 [Daedalea quercina L-15889]
MENRSGVQQIVSLISSTSSSISVLVSILRLSASSRTASLKTGINIQLFPNCTFAYNLKRAKRHWMERVVGNSGCWHDREQSLIERPSPTGSDKDT